MISQTIPLNMYSMFFGALQLRAQEWLRSVSLLPAAIFLILKHRGGQEFLSAGQAPAQSYGQEGVCSILPVSSSPGDHHLLLARGQFEDRGQFAWAFPPPLVTLSCLLIMEL